MRRVLRAAGAVVVGLVVSLTLVAVAVDLSPVGAARPATKLYAGPFVRVGSTLVAYRKWGDRGSPIVLLRDAAEPSWVWHRVGPLLASGGHRVFALDLPPFGYTERNVPPTMAGWLSLLHGFEHRLGIMRPELVGHSLGAGIAVEESIERPGSVGRVVLLDGDALAFLPAAHRLGLARRPHPPERLGAGRAVVPALDARRVRAAVPGHGDRRRAACARRPRHPGRAYERPPPRDDA